MKENLSNNRVFLLYALATYVFSWLFWVPSAVMFKSVESVFDLVTSPVFIALQTLGAAGPSVVAYCFLKRFYSPSDLKAIVNRYKIWRLGPNWYLISVFLVIGISLLSLLIQVLFFESPLVEGHALYDMHQGMGLALVAVLPLVFVAQIFSSPLLEEFGWRGFAQPLLQSRFGVLPASTVIGVVWGLWHLPLILAYGNNPAIALVSIVCHSILIGWVLNSTRGSMLMVLLFHASINVGVNMLSPGHNSIVMLLITAGVTGFVVYRMLKAQLKPFNNVDSFESRSDSVTHG